MLILNKFNMSYSIYSIYKQSQLQFFFEKISPIDKTDKVFDGYGLAGNIVHNICEEYIKDPTINTDSRFNDLWYQNNMHIKRGIGNKPYDINRYFELLNSCLRVINFLRCEGNILKTETTLELKVPELDDMTIKGIMDLIVENEAGIFIYDWKTNSGPTYEMHYDQRLFYSWLYWKKNGIIPRECKWYYAEVNDFKNDYFTLEQVQEFEKELYRVCNEIKQKGEDINNYEVGNYDTPFNAYRTACMQENAKRKNAICFKIASWGNVSQLSGEEISSTLVKALDKTLQYEKEGAHFIKKNSNWDGIVHFYNKSKSAFPTGLRSDVIKVLELYAKHLGKALELNLVDMTNYTGTIDVPEKLIDVELRDYQMDAVNAFLKSKYGIIKLKTGMGKTLLAAEIIRHIGTNTLWIINRKLLLEQTKEVFEDVLGVRIGTITEGEINLEEINICTYQTLAKHVHNKLVVDYLKTVGFIIIDETHGASAASIKAICDLCPNTSFRLGLSATPDLKKDFMEVQALVGPVCFELDKEDERMKEYLADAKITFVDVDDIDFSSDKEQYLDVYKDYVMNNKMRNDAIEMLVKRHQGKKILIITKLIEHAEYLAERLQCPSLLGKTKKEDRESIVDSFHNNKDGFVCIGSMQIVSEGWDIKELDVVIQASAPAGPVKTIQGLGRVLRKSDGKEYAYYYDFCDKNERLMRIAGRKRKYSLLNEGYEIIDEKFKS